MCNIEGEESHAWGVEYAQTAIRFLLCPFLMPTFLSSLDLTACKLGSYSKFINFYVHCFEIETISHLGSHKYSSKHLISPPNVTKIDLKYHWQLDRFLICRKWSHFHHFAEKIGHCLYCENIFYTCFVIANPDPRRDGQGRECDSPCNSSKATIPRSEGTNIKPRAKKWWWLNLYETLWILNG